METQTGSGISATHVSGPLLLIDLSRGFVHLLLDFFPFLEHLLRFLAQVRLVGRLALRTPCRRLSLGHRLRLRLVSLRLRGADAELRLEPQVDQASQNIGVDVEPAFLDHAVQQPDDFEGRNACQVGPEHGDEGVQAEVRGLIVQRG